MSQENVEVVRKSIDAYNRRDIEPLLETWDPEVEYYPFTAAVEGALSRDAVTSVAPFPPDPPPVASARG